MKTITLKMPPDGSGVDQHAGERGEHRTYQVIIPLPRATLPQIQSCVAIFWLDSQIPVRSPLILPGESGDMYIAGGKAHIVLWQQITSCRALRIQLACFGDMDGQTFLDNTPISERIMFKKSVPGGLEDMPEISDSPGLIAQIVAWLHTHPNKSVLDAFSEQDGVLFWNGEPVCSGGTADELTAPETFALLIGETTPTPPGVNELTAEETQGLLNGG